MLPHWITGNTSARPRFSSSSWARGFRVRLVQLGHGLGSPGIGDADPMLGFNSRRRLRRVPARRWPADEGAVARDLVGEEIET
jgi:hypothetical protein